MLTLQDLKPNTDIAGLETSGLVRIKMTEPIGDGAISVVYQTSEGDFKQRLIFPADLTTLKIAKSGQNWSFDADGRAFKLGLEAQRIQWAHLFDPMMAVHSSMVEPLPHQISAVYESMLPKQPLRFLLADDPGAGKTIMAGLLIKELAMRSDAYKVLVVSPGGLAAQWQDELLEKFDLHFEIFSRQKDEESASGNYFVEQSRIIARLDQLARNEDYRHKVAQTEWDLIIVDEAHKMSAHFWGGEVKKSKRYELGEYLSKISRHFLLMTATPHNGKEEDFQLFLALLDGDRFYGKFREGAVKVDTNDIMRRMVKEDLLKFDGTPLFPERRAYTVAYTLSPLEADLYASVTDYVRNEMNRADQLGGARRGSIGFALTQLQRRLASSPEAICKSLERRKKRLEERLEEERLGRRAQQVNLATIDWEDEDIEDQLSSDEFEDLADRITDQASTANTLEELQKEIQILEGLIIMAKNLVASGSDRKWEELSNLLQHNSKIYVAGSGRRKIIIFTEHKDTLNYLTNRIQNLLGDPEAVVTIHGGTNRDARRKIQEEFRNNPDVLVLVATDAASEGVNLQNTNLMVNYDLPWNPNRLEQRFGRVHRIGQTEVCHLWNLLAVDTREGDVFHKLFEKLEAERVALGGRVFDILGEAFSGKSLKDLLIEAIRYGDSPEAKERLTTVIDGVLDINHLKEIMSRNALVEQHMSLEDLYAVREQMERAEAKKLQPYYVRSFFLEAFESLGGVIKEREKGRYEIKRVPSSIRERDRITGSTRTPVLDKYERVCFEKELIRYKGKPMADLLHPGHPLIKAVLILVLDDKKPFFKRGTILVDPHDEGTSLRALVMLDHTISGEEQSKSITLSRRLQSIYVSQLGKVSFAGWAPYLDMRPIEENERSSLGVLLQADWIGEKIEKIALEYAVKEVVPEHYVEVKGRIVKQAEKTLSAVKERLVKEINYWTRRYQELKLETEAGKQPMVQPENAKRKAEELTARLESRIKELQTKMNVQSSPPKVVSCALIVPQGLLENLKDDSSKASFTVDAEARKRVELIAMKAVMDAEKELGHSVKDVSAEKCGWDVTGTPTMKGDYLPPARHIEVKGRAKGQNTVTFTRNEIMTALNQRGKFWQAIVLVDGEEYEGPFYVNNLFNKEPGIGEISINYDLSYILELAVKPKESI